MKRLETNSHQIFPFNDECVVSVVPKASCSAKFNEQGHFFLVTKADIEQLFEESKHELSDLCDLIADILELHFKAVDEDKKTS